MYKKYILTILASLYLICMVFYVLMYLGDLKKTYKIIKIGKTRSEIVFKSSSIEVDDILLPYVIEFIDEALEYNINIDSLSRTYIGVYYDYPPTGFIGIAYKKEYGLDAYALVSPLLGSFVNKLRATVFHELAHYYLNRSHCHIYCRQIMSTKLNIYIVYNNWDQQKRILFNNIHHEEYRI